MDDKIADLKSEALDAIGAAVAADDVDSLRTRYLGRKGAVTGLLRDVGLFALDLSPALKREFVRYTAGTAASAEYRNVHP